MTGFDLKRLLDLLASALGLVLTSPVLGIVAVAVRADSPGRVLFRQERVGLGGITFTIHKFRTMYEDHAGAEVTSSNEVRITRSGRVLRKTKLDELPQLFDVLRGKMSLVGPRPEVPRYAALWPAELRDQILSVRPGITDPVSLELRNESDLLAAASDPEAYYVDTLLPYKASKYAEYVETRSLRGDLVIILRTIGAVVAR